MPHSIRELIPYTSPIHDATREASPEYGSMALQKYRNLVFCKAHYYIMTSAEYILCNILIYAACRNVISYKKDIL